MRILIFLILLLSLNFGEDCKSCHKIEHFDDKNHNFSCSSCHLKPKNRQNYDHKRDIITHSASAKNMEIFCAKCHEKEIKKFKSSNHYTLKNEINLVYKTFGLDTNYTLQTLPKPPIIIKNKKDLVTDMLRRKCLKCHSETKKIYENGSYRGKGCMACHGDYDEFGLYKGEDKLIKNKFGLARIHKLIKKPENKACLACHNKEFVGGDYLGLFPKDHDKSYRGPISKDGKFSKQIYGIDFHHLSPDIHHEKGLKCADCHKAKSVLGLKKVSCKTCHKNLSVQNHDKNHKNLACETCHSSWQNSSYELSMLRDDTKNYEQWDRLMLQEDGYLEKFLKFNAKRVKQNKKPLKPKMPDYVSGEFKDGIWYSGWQIRRYENLLLGNGEDGKIYLLRPIFQYRMSYKNKNGKMIFDDFFKDDTGKFEAFMPFSPHTISKRAKSCEKCHENTLKNDDLMGIFEGKTINSSPLNESQIQKLQSKKYKMQRAKMLFEEH